MKWKNQFILTSLLIIIGFFTYAPSLSGQLFWDDNDFILNNTYVTQGKFKEFFTAQALEGAGKPSNYFRPIQFTFYTIVYQLFGSSPLPFHTLNICIHLLAAVAVYFFFIEFSKRIQQLPIYFPFLIALVFLIHPIQTEAVSYVSGLSDPIVTLFGFGSLMSFIRYPSKKIPIISIGLYILTVLSKESGVIFSGIIGCIWLLRTFTELKNEGKIGSKKRIVFLVSFIRQLLPYAAITVIYLLYHTQIIHVIDMAAIYGEHTYTHSIAIRIITFLQLLPTYIVTMLFPLVLYYDRDFSVVLPTSIWNISSFILIFFTFNVLGVLILLKKQIQTFSLVLFFIFCFMVAVLPFSGIILINGLMYEHYMYIPIIFFFASVVLLFDIGITLCTSDKSIRFRSNFKMTLSVLLILFSIGFIIRSYIRQYEWIDPIRFYQHTLRYVPNSFRVRNNLAIEYQKRGMYYQAISEYLEVIENAPSVPNPYHNLANIYLSQKNYKDAESYFKQAIDVDPTFGYSYSALVKLYQETGETEKEKAITAAIKQQFTQPEDLQR